MVMLFIVSFLFRGVEKDMKDHAAKPCMEVKGGWMLVDFGPYLVVFGFAGASIGAFLLGLDLRFSFSGVEWKTWVCFSKILRPIGMGPYTSASKTLKHQRVDYSYVYMFTHTHIYIQIEKYIYIYI